MSNQSEEGSILCTQIGAKLWPSTSSRPTISTSANTTWRVAGTVWSVQNIRQLSLHGTNITPIQNSKALAASSFTFNPVQLYSTCSYGG
jgi:hypothetical protein